MGAVLYTKALSVLIFMAVSTGAYLASAQDTGQPVAMPMEPATVAPTASLEDNEDCFTDDIQHSCPPGNYVCDGGDGRSDCCFCPNNTFQLWYNNCPSCVVCTDCKKFNRMTIHMCNTSQDTVCGKKLPLTTIESTALTEASSVKPVIEDGTSSPCKDCDCFTSCPPQQCIQNDTKENTTVKQDCDCPPEIDDVWWHHPVFMSFTFCCCLLAPSILFVVFPSVAEDTHDLILKAINHCRGLRPI